MLKRLMSDLAKDEENSYRQFYLKPNIRFAQIGLLLILIPIAAFVINDLYFVSLSAQFFEILALRCGLLSFSVLAFIKIGKIEDYRLYDRTVTLTALILLVGCAIINVTRPINFIAQVVMTVIAIFILYLVIPNRYLNQVLLSSIAMIGEITIIFVFLQPTSSPTLFTLLLGLALANVIGALTAWQLHTYRKKSYLDYLRSTEMQKKLEVHTRDLEMTVADRTKELRDKERLATIGATAGMVGHDIRNPLQAITSDLYLITSDLNTLPESEGKEGIRESVESIQNNVEYINKIVQDLQDYTRPLAPILMEIDLELLFRELLANNSIPKGIITHYNIQDEAKKIVADIALLKRILSNLISNAVQAMPNGGELSIYAYKKGEDILITVQDTGMGIPDIVKAKLFTPLFTTKSKGQGFGLAVVKRIAESLGGTVTFESQEGKGSTFTISLPQQSAKTDFSLRQ